jgi:AAHS family 4-hydroxybenzoate transporter-like MFS transporter
MAQTSAPYQAGMGETMSAKVIDVERLINEKKMSAFHIGVIFMTFLVVTVDGFDITAASFAAPGLIKTFHISPTSLGALFSAALVAGLIGTPVFGFLADRFGRKRVMLWGSVFFGVFTLAALVAQTFQQMILFRFIAGIGVAGVLPTSVAYVSEFAPRKFRATVVSIMFTGSPVGSIISGLVAAKLMPIYGWKILFWIAGLSPLVLALALAFLLPESIHFLVRRPKAREQLAGILRRFEPGLQFDPDTRFVSARHQSLKPMPTSALFAGRLKLLTPLIWVANVLSLMTFYFANQWLPTLLAHSAAGPSGAAMATTLFICGGVVGALVIMRPIDKWGFLPVPILFLCGVPALIAVGAPGMGVQVLLSIVVMAGFCLYGVQYGLIASEGPLFPPPVRGRGVGFCFAAGRVGATFGPLIGGYLISRHLPMQTLFMVAAIPLGLGVLVSAVITPLYRKQVLEVEGSVSPAFDFDAQALSQAAAP